MNCVLPGWAQGMAQEKLPATLESPNENLSDPVNVSHWNYVK